MSADLAVFVADFTGRSVRATLSENIRVTGANKLAQRFILALLDPETTGLVDFVRAGRIRTSATAQQYGNLAVVSAAAKIRQEQRSDDTVDDILQNVTLLSASLIAGRLDLQIRVVSGRGDPVQLVIPVR